MASTTIIHFIDDIDGSVAERTVSFGIDGSLYSIDLSAAHIKELEEILAQYIARARRTGRGRVEQIIATRIPRGTAVASSRANRDRNTQIREWAAASGQQLADRGRIPQSVVNAYEIANAEPAAAPPVAVAEATEPTEQAKPKRHRKPPAATFSGGEQ